MMTIWKYHFAIAKSFDIEMPSPARVLSVQNQDGIPTMWVNVDDKAPMGKHRFYIRGTGWDCSDVVGYRFLGTIQERGFVWHVFDGE
jgi:hypothetical protein